MHGSTKATIAYKQRTCSAPMRDKSHTMSRLSAPHDARMVSHLGFHPICMQHGGHAQSEEAKHLAENLSE